VSSGRELVGVVIESLKRLQDTDLKGQTPRAPFLWDPTSRGTYKPKSESWVSNYVKAFLEQDLRTRGIIVNREVEVHGPEGLGRTDIHVDAVAREKRGGWLERVKLVIELKGSWNKDLRSSMQNQLVRDYLSTPDCRDGIYLVCWFDTARWDAEDYRRGQVPKWTIEEARAFFANQASDSSASDRLVASFVLDCTS
jgi:hypothetical protein